MSYTRSYFHIVFGTKFHQRTINMDRRERIYGYLTNIIKNKKSTSIAINGMEEHIHILLDLHPSVALADMVKSIKQSSSKWISGLFILPMFEGWAPEYYASSVSPAHVERVKAYINGQEEHHSRQDFEREMDEYVKKLGFEIYRG